jgi:hypothetical protein
MTSDTYSSVVVGLNSRPHGVQSSACADVNIWSGTEEERSCWRDGRGIGEIGEKMGEKMGEM